jgi:phage-related protein
MMNFIPIVPVTDNTCETCDNRLGEECGYDGHKVHNDNYACSLYSKRESLS